MKEVAREILANKNELTKASWHEFVLGIMSSHILLLHFFVRMLNFSLDSQVIVVCVMDGVGVCTTYAYAHLPKNKLSDAADYARKWENQWSWNKNKRKQQTYSYEKCKGK